MDARTAARIAAVQAIFEKEHNPLSVSDAKFLASTFDVKKVNKKLFDQITTLVKDDILEIDKAISDNLSKDWRFDRLNSILKAILRAGIAEIKFTDTPKNVVLSEYVSIADNFVDEDEVRFVNALLDKI